MPAVPAVPAMTAQEKRFAEYLLAEVERIMRAELEKALHPVAPLVAADDEGTTEKPKWYLKQSPRTVAKGGTPAA